MNSNVCELKWNRSQANFKGRSQSARGIFIFILFLFYFLFQHAAKATKDQKSKFNSLLQLTFSFSFFVNSLFDRRTQLQNQLKSAKDIIAKVSLTAQLAVVNDEIQARFPCMTDFNNFRAYVSYFPFEAKLHLFISDNTTKINNNKTTTKITMIKTTKTTIYNHNNRHYKNKNKNKNKKMKTLAIQISFEFFTMWIQFAN